MDHTRFEGMFLERVFQIKPYGYIIDIYFTLHGQKYSLRTDKRNDVSVPIEVFHESNQRCLVCGASHHFTPCRPLTKKRYRLFYHLIEFPSIRLEWIFLNHDKEL